jgi:hypothetical protein
MTTVRIRNNTAGTTLQIDRQGNITITGSSITVQTTARESVQEDAPTNSMSAQAIAGGRDGDQPPIRKNSTKGVIAAMLRRKMKEPK